MRKIYAMAAAAMFAAVPMSARELTFYMGDTPIADGSKIEFAEIEKMGTMVMMAPKLYIGSDVAVNKVKITATCTSGQSIQMCAGGACESATEVVKENLSIGSNAKLDLQFEYITYVTGDDQTLPTVVTDFSAVDEAHDNVTAAFTLVMNPESGVAAVLKVNDAFRAVKGGIAYSFETPAAVEVYNLAGEKVIEASVEGNGTLSTAGLPEGVYVYRAGNATGKLYIR